MGVKRNRPSISMEWNFYFCIDRGMQFRISTGGKKFMGEI